jgi:cysteinyl-tRNA synthetase
MKFYNTLSRKKENFVPVKNNQVSIYVCGITPYDTTHLGHAFTYVSFDVLIRYLEFKNLKVNYTQNVTDINDRDNDILKRAKEQKISWQSLSDFWTKKFLGDMEKLNWRFPDNYLYASKEIESMITLIKKLIKNGIAYEVSGNVYLDIEKAKDYGKLSRLSKLEMIKIANEYEENTKDPNKKNPLDIILWRASFPNQPIHIPSFDSPFGKGRPGWHIECSAMAISSLGQRIDIHGGGQDLIFPHHEAEIAQSENATGKKPFSKFWLHTGIISYQGQKISKSLGNLVLVSDLFTKYSANAIRWLLLSHHYRQSWEFTYSDMDKAQSVILEVEEALGKKLSHDKPVLDYISQLELFMDDDLNTPKILNLIYEICCNINSGKETNKKTQENLKVLLGLLGFKFN